MTKIQGNNRTDTSAVRLIERLRNNSQRKGKGAGTAEGLDGEGLPGIHSNGPKALQQRVKKAEKNNRKLQQENSMLQKESPASRSNEEKALLQRIQELEKNNQRLQKENSVLKKEQQEKRQQPITKSGGNSEDCLPIAHDTQQTIEDLQNRVVRLVEDKLALQNLVGFLEHQFAEGTHLNADSFRTHKGTLYQEMQSTIDDLQQRVMVLVEEKLNLQHLLDVKHKGTLFQEMQSTIDDLQQRVMVLVEEKLNLQNSVDVLEHKKLTEELCNDEKDYQQKDDNNDGKWRAFDANVEEIEAFDSTSEALAAMTRTSVVSQQLYRRGHNLSTTGSKSKDFESSYLSHASIL